MGADFDKGEAATAAFFGGLLVAFIPGILAGVLLPQPWGLVSWLAVWAVTAVAIWNKEERNARGT